MLLRKQEREQEEDGSRPRAPPASHRVWVWPSASESSDEMHPLSGAPGRPLCDLGLPLGGTPPPPCKPQRRRSRLLDPRAQPDGLPLDSAPLLGKHIQLQRLWGKGPQGPPAMALALHNNSKMPPSRGQSNRPSPGRFRFRPDRDQGWGWAVYASRGGAGTGQVQGAATQEVLGGVRRPPWQRSRQIRVTVQRSETTEFFLCSGQRGLAVRSGDKALSGQ